MFFRFAIVFLFISVSPLSARDKAPSTKNPLASITKEILSEKKCIPCQGGMAPLEGEVITELHALLGDSWQVVEKHHLEKVWHFTNFQEALEFTNLVGILAEQEGHHPDIYLAWGKVKLIIWTHKIDGLSISDFIFAAKCDLL